MPNEKAESTSTGPASMSDAERAESITRAFATAPDPTDHRAVWTFGHTLIERGCTVLFVLPGTKVPADVRPHGQRTRRLPPERPGDVGTVGPTEPRGGGVYQATNDPNEFNRQFRTYTKEHGKGCAINLAIVPGPSRLVVVDADTPEQVAAFVAATGLADATPTVRSPGKLTADGEWAHRDGGHWWFVVPEGVELPADRVKSMTAEGDWAVFWGPGKYVLIPPSRRPEGDYTCAGAVATLPSTLGTLILDHITARTERAARARERIATGELDTVQRWGASMPWHEILAPTQWVNTGRAYTCGCDIWTAPGLHGTERSAIAHEPGCEAFDSPDPPLYCFTDHDREPFETVIARTGRQTVTRLEAFAAIHHNDDLGAAMTALGIRRASGLSVDYDHAPPGHEADENGAGPGGLFVNIAEVLSGGGVPKAVPTILTRADGKCLFYPGKVNLLFGDPETAKTWIALAAGGEVLDGGGRFVFVDMDHNGVETTVERLVMLGGDTTVLADPARFLYVEPEDSDHLLAVVGHLTAWEPTMALLDSVGELLPLMGANSDRNDDVTTAFNVTASPLARAGAGVVLIDHLAKNAESRRLGPVGAYGKTRIINGTMVRVFRQEQFTPGRGASSPDSTTERARCQSEDSARRTRPGVAGAGPTMRAIRSPISSASCLSPAVKPLLKSRLRSLPTTRFVTSRICVSDAQGNRSSIALSRVSCSPIPITVTTPDYASDSSGRCNT